MADFIQAFNRTIRFEGGYVNDKFDSGGETYMGIARKCNPHWLGWKIIDSYKGKPNFPKSLDKDRDLYQAVLSCYSSLYWSKIWGDKLDNQEVANDLFDTAVNMGVKTSIKLAQRQFKLSETGVMDEELFSKLNSVRRTK